MSLLGVTTLGMRKLTAVALVGATPWSEVSTTQNLLPYCCWRKARNSPIWRSSASAMAELLLLDQLARELDLVIVGVGSAADQFVVIDRLAASVIMRGGGTQYFAVGVLPFEVQVFLRMLLAVEIRYPARSLVHVIRRSHPGPAGV